MSRAKAQKTRFPGVYQFSDKPGQFRVWAQLTSPKTGKKTTIDKIVAARNPSHANELRAEIVEATRAELESTRERATLRQFALSWMRTKLPSLAPSTRAVYASHLDHHILPALGDHYLDAITRDDVVAFRDAQLSRTRDTASGPRPASPESVRGYLRVLHTVLEDAAADGRIPRNPAARLPALRRTRRAKTRKDLDAGALARFLEAARVVTPSWWPLFVVAAFTGLRFGELTYLHWSDVDESRGVLRVHSSHWKGHESDTTKTGAAREVPITPEVLDALRVQRATLLAAQHPGLGAGLVFPARRRRRKGEAEERAALMFESATRKPIKTALAAAGVDMTGRSFSNHGFRHTLNNLVRRVAQGEVVRAITGHSSEAMTHHYSHVDTAEKAAAVGAVVRLVRASKSLEPHLEPGTGATGGASKN